MRFNEVKNVDGQTSNLCISCSNGFETINQDNVVISQRPYIPDDISTVHNVQEDENIEILKPKDYDLIVSKNDLLHISTDESHVTIESLSKEPFLEKIELKFINKKNEIIVKDVMFTQGFYDENNNKTKVDLQ